MERKRIVQVVVLVCLVITNLVLFSSARSLRQEQIQSSDRLLGEKSGIITLSAQLSKDENLLQTFKDNGGEKIKKAYAAEEEAKQKVFDDYERLSKELLDAERMKDSKKEEEVREKIDQVMVLGSSRELFLYRGTDWKMALNKQIPTFSINGKQPNTISISDGQNRTVALLTVLYDDDQKQFQLLEVVKTLEWLEPTDVFVPGSGEVGVFSSSSDITKKGGEE